MTCNLEKNKGVSVKSLPLGGEGASLQFVTLAGSEPGQLAEHAELLQKAEKNGLRWIGPEVYGSADLDISPVPGAGMTAFLGTKTGASFYRGMQICAVEGVNARAIEFNGRSAGVFYEDEYAEYAVLGGLSPRDRTAGRTEQTLDVFRQMEEALNRAGMDFSHVVRTWFYNNRLLDWYEEFNRARDTFFESRGVFDRLVPASTGIGSGNRENAALSARVFAIRPKGDRVTVKRYPFASAMFGSGLPQLIQPCGRSGPPSLPASHRLRHGQHFPWRRIRTSRRYRQTNRAFAGRD